MTPRFCLLLGLLSSLEALQIRILPPVFVSRAAARYAATPTGSRLGLQTSTQIQPRTSPTIVASEAKVGKVQRTKRYVVVLPPKAAPKSKAVVKPPLPEAPSEFTKYAAEYWYDPRIHSMGNIGPKGLLAAICAPLATYLIDKLSYGGVDVRNKIHETIPADSSVLDFCCGTGFSTAPIRDATGVDTSREFLSVARLRRPDARFAFGNAETYGDTASVDVVTMMFATHEMPSVGRRRVLRNAMRVAKKTVIVADIDPDFHGTLRDKPGKGGAFLAGEPYVLGYLENMDDDVASCMPVRFGGPSWRLTRTQILPKHVCVWRLDRVD